MIIYSVTVNIDNKVQEEWVNWMRQIHIPQVMATGCFIKYTFLRLLTEEDNGGTTYNLQYHAQSMDAYVDYQDNFASSLQAEHTSRYKDQFVAFRTLLETVEV